MTICSKEVNKTAVTEKIDLSKEIRDWKDAQLGKEVRAAQISVLEKTQTHINAAIEHVNQSASEVQNAAAETQRLNQKAEGTLKRADETVDYADEILEETVRQAREILNDGAQHTKEAAESAKLSESWARGGTESRQGENTDNSMYYSQQAKTEAGRAKEEADRASQYSQIVAPGFYFNPEDGNLYMKSGVGVSFLLSDARLYWKIG